MSVCFLSFFSLALFFLLVLSYYSVLVFTSSYFIFIVYSDGIGEDRVRIWVGGKVVRIWEALGRGTIIRL